MKKKFMTESKINHPGWAENLTIYEVNIRQYTKSGTINDFIKHLPRLKELGIGILWFMPVQPIGIKNRKGTLGSYYSIKNYTEINPEFGTLDDFKNMVNEIHKLGMYVIIDWVANHTSWDHLWTKSHPDFYDLDDKGDFKPPFPEWEDVIHLNYNNPALWDAMIGEMKFWLEQTGIDGFRSDMAHLVPTYFWNRARFELTKSKELFFLAESENHDLLEYAFDSIYNWKLLHAMNDIAAGKINAKELGEIIQNELNHFPANASQLNFTCNHDENSWNGSAIERLHYYLEPLSILTFTLSGYPLIYSGQEAGNYRRLNFFDKDAVDWKKDKMAPFFQKLNNFKRTCNELWDGGFNIIETDSKQEVFAFSRGQNKEKVVVILNLSSKDKSFKLLNNKHRSVYFDIFKEVEVELSGENTLKLHAYDYFLLEKK
jgi:glycosidase